MNEPPPWPDWMLARATERLHWRIETRCEDEYARTKQQGEAARRSMAQLFRWHGGRK